MKKLNINIDNIYKMTSIKSGIIYKDKNYIYKIAKSKEELIKKIESLYKNTEYEKYLCLADSLLYQDNFCYGLRLPYIKNLTSINNLNEEYLNTYFLKLLEILEEFNKNNLLYYDCHDGNILVKDNLPFILDLDSTLYLQEDYPFNRNIQIEYLIEFILSAYFKIYKYYFLTDYLKNISFNKYYSKDFCKYLSNLEENKDDYTRKIELPYIIIEELKDKEKIDKIKKLI
jgi:hypothetical protein